MPIGLSRGFRNAGDDTAYMLAIVGGTDPGKVEWPQETVDMAREHSIGLDENGELALLNSAAD